MFSSFKRMYNFRSVTNGKIFIFLYLSCLSFFVASGGSNKKMCSVKMRAKVISIKRRFEEANLAFEPIVGDEVSSLENNIRIEDLAKLILHADGICLNKEELDLLKGFNDESISKNDSKLSYRIGISNKLKSIAPERRTKSLMEEFMDFSRDDNNKNKGNNRNKKNVSTDNKKYTTACERNQLWEILIGNDFEWNSFCKENIEDIAIDADVSNTNTNNNTDNNSTITSAITNYPSTNTNENNSNRTNIMAMYSNSLSKIYPGEDDEALFMRIYNKIMFLKGLIKSQKQKKGVNQYKKLIKMYDAILSSSMKEAVSTSILVSGEFKRDISSDQENKFEQCNLLKEAKKVKGFFGVLFGIKEIPYKKNSNSKVITADTDIRVFEFGCYCYFWFVEKTAYGYRNLLLMYNKKDNSSEIYSFEEVYKIFFMKFLNERATLLGIEENGKERKRLMKINELGQLDKEFLMLLNNRIHHIQGELDKEKKFLEGLDWNWELVINNNPKIQKQQRFNSDDDDDDGETVQKKDENNKGKKVEREGFIEWIAISGIVEISNGSITGSDCVFLDKNNKNVRKKLLLLLETPLLDNDNEEVYKEYSEIIIVLYRLDINGDRKDERVFKVGFEEDEVLKIYFENGVGTADASFFLENASAEYMESRYVSCKDSYSINNILRSFSRNDTKKWEEKALKLVNREDSTMAKGNSENKDKTDEKVKKTYKCSNLKKKVKGRISLKEKNRDRIQRRIHIVSKVKGLECIKEPKLNVENNDYIDLANRIRKKKLEKGIALSALGLFVGNRKMLKSGIEQELGEIREEVSYCCEKTKVLYEKLSEVERLLNKDFDNVKNNKVLVSLEKEREQTDSDGGHGVYKKKVETETIFPVDKLEKVKHKLSEQYLILSSGDNLNDDIEENVDLSSNHHPVSSGDKNDTSNTNGKNVTFSTDRNTFLHDGNRQDSYYNGTSCSVEKIKYKPTRGGNDDSSNNFRKPSPTILEKLLGSKLGKWCNNIFSSVIFFYIEIAFAVTFLLLSAYDFYLVSTEASAQEGKKRKKGKRKKLSLSRKIFISLRKTVYRYFFFLSFKKDEKEKIRVSNKRRSKKKTNRKYRTNRKYGTNGKHRIS